VKKKNNPRIRFGGRAPTSPSQGPRTTTALTSPTRAGRGATSPTPTPTTSWPNWRRRGTTTNPSPRQPCSSLGCRGAADGLGHHPTTTATTPPSAHMPSMIVSLDTSRTTFLSTTTMSHIRTHTLNQISPSQNSPSSSRSTTTSSPARGPRATILVTAYRWMRIVAVITVAVTTIIGRG